MPRHDLPEAKVVRVQAPPDVYKRQSYETTNANASPAIYFDSYGHAVVPLLGGIAIRDLNAEEDVYKRQAVAWLTAAGMANLLLPGTVLLWAVFAGSGVWALVPLSLIHISRCAPSSC